MKLSELLSMLSVKDMLSTDLYVSACHIHGVNKTSKQKPIKVKLVLKGRKHTDKITQEDLKNMLSVISEWTVYYYVNQNTLDYLKANWKLLLDNPITPELNGIFSEELDYILSSMFDVYGYNKNGTLKTNPMNYYFRHYTRSKVFDSNNHISFFFTLEEAEEFYTTQKAIAVSDLEEIKVRKIAKINEEHEKLLKTL